jgi:hypothetical protein
VPGYAATLARTVAASGFQVIECTAQYVRITLVTWMAGVVPSFAGYSVAAEA